MTKRYLKASHRIAAEFMDMLDKQFPIENHHPISVRFPSQFADRLNIHVNHLNRVIKETVNKTTTEVISERILHEAKILLRNSNLSVAEIAYVLRFSEATHFNNFFKVHTQMAPTKFRSG